MQITLRAARINAGFTQKELADELDRNVSTIANWESNKTKISLPDFKKLCQVLKVNENDIFLGY